MPAGKDDSKKGFLSDAGSFVNAGGGNLILGITEVGKYSQARVVVDLRGRAKAALTRLVRPA